MKKKAMKGHLRMPLSLGIQHTRLDFHTLPRHSSRQWLKRTLNATSTLRATTLPDQKNECVIGQ